MKVISGESYIEHVNPEESESKKTVREELERQEDTLEELLTSLHGDSSAEVIVYRQPGSGQQRLKALFTCVPEDYTLVDLINKLRDEYAGGSYRIHVRKGALLIGNKTLDIEMPRNWRPPVIHNNENELNGTGGGNGLAAAISEMMRGQAAMMQAMMDRSTTQRESSQDMLKTLVVFKELFGGVKQQDPLDMLSKMMGIQREITGVIAAPTENANSNDVLISLINNVLPKLGDIGAAMAAAKDPVTPAITHQPRAPQISAPQTEGDAQMRLQLVYLCSMAEKNNAPDTYAHMILDNTPDEKLDELLDFIASPDSLEKMAKIHAPVAKHAEWFKRLGECVLELIDDSDETDETDENTKNIENISEEIPQNTVLNNELPSRGSEGAKKVSVGAQKVAAQKKETGKNKFDSQKVAPAIHDNDGKSLTPTGKGPEKKQAAKSAGQRGEQKDGH